MLFDGTKSCGCNEPGQVQADRWIVRDEKTVLELHLAQFTPSTAVRECSDCVCAEETRGCWVVLVVEGDRAVSRIAERNCDGGERMAERSRGGTTAREEGVRSRGSSSGFQGNETTRCESVLDGTDCCGLKWKLHGKHVWEQSCRAAEVCLKERRSLRSSSQCSWNWCREI